MKLAFWKRENETQKPPKLAKRGFSAAQVSRLLSGWTVTNDTVNREIYASLRALRSRSRDLEHNNAFVKQVFRLLQMNIVGRAGITLQARFSRGGDLDVEMNRQLEDGFRRWGKVGVCDATGRYSWRDVQNLCVHHMARDGEVLLRFVEHRALPWGMALEVIDPDLLDENYNEGGSADGSKNAVVMGVEIDSWKRPAAFWLRREQVSVTYQGMPYERIRVPASEMLHLFLPYRADQVRGVPWLHAVMEDLAMVGSYKTAELTAARLAAAKMGFFLRDGATRYEGEEEDSEGNVITEVEPGTFEELPPGLRFEKFDPTHPTGNFGTFMKAILHGVASGIGVSYSSMTGDLTEVNFSSIRAGLLAERDYYQTIQDWLIEHLCEKVYERWLLAAYLSNKIRVPGGDVERYLSPSWLPRRWAWVDPLKDVEANIQAVSAGFKSRREVTAEQGRDFEDVIDELSLEQHLAEKKGVVFLKEEPKSVGKIVGNPGEAQG